MKYVAVRIVEQWPNIMEYFLTFLPKQKGFSRVKSTDRYQRIESSLKDNSTLAYISFCAYISQDFEAFLLPFQSEEPMIHVLYPEMINLLTTLMRKFIKRRQIDESPVELYHLDVSKGKNQRPLNLIDIGTKAKLLFSDVNFMPSEKQEQFRRDCLNFYIAAVTYLQIQLPFDNQVLKYAQYLHPMKRHDPSSCSAISNLTLKVAASLKTCLLAIFKVNSSDATPEGICDFVRTQWKVYQSENISEDTYINSHNTMPSSRFQQSYWDYALDVCNMKPLPKRDLTFVRIDKYWSSVGKMVDDNGFFKYPQLFALVKCVLSLSHGNAVPERGFSINKILLESHGYTIANDTVSALRLVKDMIHRHGGVCKFPMTNKLLCNVRNSHSRYVDHLEHERQLVKEEQALLAKKVAAESAAAAKKAQSESLIDKIKTCELQLDAANDIVEDANREIQSVLGSSGKKVDKHQMQLATSKLQVGMDRKKKLDMDLKELRAKKAKLS